ncbi:MAG: DUF6502 family protein [Pseudomonadales bacterium]
METKSEMVRALRTLLRPIVRLQIACGLNARDFVEILKSVYVEVASSEYGKRGRKANMSRVAVLTGLTRREVARLRNVNEHDPLQLQDPMVPVGRVLSAWHQERRYLDVDGQPRPLARGTEFLELINQCRGDIPATAVIKELEAAGSIRIDGGLVRAISRYFLPVPMDSGSIERLGRVLADVGSTITHNMLATEEMDSRFEGRAVHERVSLGSSDAFRNYLDRRGQELLVEMDDWLHDHGETSESDSVQRMGVGIYMIGGIE